MDYSLADLKAIVDDDKDGMFGGNGFLWVILIFLFFLAFNGNGLGFGGNNNVASGMSQVERDVLETSCATQKSVMESQYQTLLGFKDLSYQNQICCCDLKTAIHAEGEATRALIQENTITDLRERLNTANNALTTQTIVNQVVAQLQPTPRPAYIVGNPYCNYNFGCGCNGNNI